MATTEEKLLELEGKVEALIDALSGKQATYADGEKVKRFIDNYSVIVSIIENDGVSKLIHDLVSLQRSFEAISGRVDGLVGAVEVESKKMISALGSGSSGVALNIADMIMFQTSVSDAYKSMLQHLRELDITGKINRMESSLTEALGLIKAMKQQKEQINVLLQRVADDEAVVAEVQEVNDRQQKLIENTENMIAEVEKQIENYAFYAEEFDKVYVNAKNFVSRFTTILEELERVSARDAKLEALMNNVISVSFQDLEKMEQIVNTLAQAINSLGLNTAQKLEDMMQFINEFNAVGLALSGVSQRMQEVSSTCGDKINELSSVQFGLDG